MRASATWSGARSEPATAANTVEAKAAPAISARLVDDVPSPPRPWPVPQTRLRCRTDAQQETGPIPVADPALLVLGHLNALAFEHL
jgi:hypothetical protein